MDIVMHQSSPLEISNEFARIKIEVDDSGNGPRLKITSILLGREIYLDPLQLESLTWGDIDYFSELFATPFGPENK
jgi:hypothetical protein